MISNKKIKLINITGWGRSGSTILGNILGQYEGFFYAGETRNIWRLGLVENRLCGCKKPFKECETWSAIFKEAFGDFDRINALQTRELIDSYTRTRYIPFLFLPGSKHFFSSHLKSFLENEQKLFASICNVTNTSVIVDSTKSTIYGYLLSLLEDVDYYVVHLVRDPCGVAYSWQKKKVHPDSSKVIYMENYNSLQSSVMWVVRNWSSEKLWKKRKGKYLLVRYKDFVTDPKNTINNILNLVGENPHKSPFTSSTSVSLDTNHTVWGNPSRFKTGIIELKPDEEWKEKLSLKDKIISRAITFPWLIKYGYNGRS